MFQREIPIIKEEGLKKLQDSNVLLFGLGGVGGILAETLVRCGIGKITIVDFDIVNESNKNRQIIALNSTIGMKKTEALKNRLLDINENLNIETQDLFIDANTINEFDFTKYNYVIDAVDNVTAKILIIEKAKQNNVKVISSMGTGNKIDPSKFQIKDISKTTMCPLAKVMRLELRKRNIKDVKVLFSIEEPIKSDLEENGKLVVSSIMFNVAVAGIMIAREVILDTIND